MNNFVGNEKLKAAIDQYRNVVDTHLGRLPELKNLKSLDRAELVGNLVGDWITSGGVGWAVKGGVRVGGMVTKGVTSGAGKAAEWAKGVGETASEKVRAALAKMPREKAEAALKEAEAVIEKLKQSSSMEKLMEAAGKVTEAARNAAESAPAKAIVETTKEVAEAAGDAGKKLMETAGEAGKKAAKVTGRVARKAVEAAPEAAEIATGAAIAGGEATNDLKKEGLSDSEAKTGGRVTSLVDTGIATGARKFLPKEWRWVSELLRGAASKGIKESVKAANRRQREQAGSRLPSVEDLRNLLIDGY